MKKQNLLKLAFTMMAMVIITGAMAQYPATIETNYVQATEVTYQTTGNGMTLYVAPDPVLSPSYTGSGIVGINPTSLWTWLLDGTEIKAASNQNYVEITTAQIGAAGGVLVFSVSESIAGITCTGDPVTQTVNVVAAPSAAITVNPTIGAAAWTLESAGVWQTCISGLTEDITATFTETGVPATYARYAYKLDVTVTDLDGDLVPIGTPTTTTYGPAIDGVLETSPAVNNVTFNLGTTVGTARTQYVIKMQPTTVGSYISRVSQFRGGVSSYAYYPAPANEFTFYVNQEPVTGPIYHIPNNYVF